MNSAFLAGLLCASAVRAAVTPTAPGPGQSFNEGGDCPIQWNLDTTGKWTSFSIDLMSGSNTAMALVTNVASGLDGTKGATSRTWKCPKVTPNSAIYFYQFSQTGADTAWTTRFQIASATGSSTPPANSAQPDGKPIPWGIGQMEGASTPTTPSNATAAKTPATPPAPSSTNSTNATTMSTSVNSSAVLSLNSSSEDAPASPVNSSSTVQTIAGTNSTGNTSGPTPKLSQTPSSSSNGKASTTSSSGSSTSGPGASPSNGASALLPAPLALLPIVIAAMVFST